MQLQFHGQSFGPISLSLGVASYPEHGATARAVLSIADAALDRAKAAGRDRSMVGEGYLEVRHGNHSGR